VRRLLLALFPLLATATAGAQIIRPRFELREPSAWISGGMELEQSWTVTDGATGSRWEFGSSTPYVASIEKAITSGVSIGVRGTTGKVPLRYVGPSATYESDARVSQLFGIVHATSGSSFHSVLELSAGATIYNDFRARTTDTPLPPLATDPDFAFAFAYGFGYAISPKFSVDVVQDMTTTLHQKTGLSAGDDSSARIQSTRIVARLGF
jgi:hypothetical protein